MPPTASANQSNTWLLFALLTVVTWGVYGVFLAKGRILISPNGIKDPNGLFKAFLFVGIAYFLVAVLAPIGMLLMNGADWKMEPAGMTWSLIAGIVGAIGAFGVLLAFGAKGSPAVVMTIVFAGAPVINGLVGITLDGSWDKVPFPFYIGLALAIAGGATVTYFKPPPIGHGPATPPAITAPAAPSASPVK